MGSYLNLTATDGHRSRAYVAGDPDEKRGLVLCHGHAGLNRHIRRVADRMAALGFRVVAPALFDRAEPGLELAYTTGDRARGRALAAQLPMAQTMLDVAAAAAAIGSPTVAILGYDFGATVAWQAAANVPALRAAVCFYGAGIADARQATPRCPTQLHFGEYDDHIPAAYVEAIRHAQPAVAIEFYPGAAHGFACGEMESFNQAAAEAAHDNTLAFLYRHLGAPARAQAAVEAANGPVAARRRVPEPAWQQVAFGRRAYA
jgi:carboxymethylenebutenolidase